jgi:hypothetical protein
MGRIPWDHLYKITASVTADGITAARHRCAVLEGSTCEDGRPEVVILEARNYIGGKGRLARERR